MASYKIEVAKKVQKSFQSIPKKDALRILEAIQDLAENPRPQNAKKLTGEELYRLRVGLYRVIYEIIDHTLVITVVKVGHRKDIYKK
jgi:mRNA interferase RelE/StbE